MASNLCPLAKSWIYLCVYLTFLAYHVFTPVCHSVHRGVGFPACITDHKTSTKGVCIQGGWADLPTTETRKVGSMHPTGMLSCLLDKNSTKIHYFFSPVRLVSAMHIHMLDFCLC